jgi:type IV pilus assembly protein PilA
MYSRRHSAFTLVEIMLAAIAIPSFQKVRHNAQDKTVASNLRHLSIAADQFFLEHGVSSVSSSSLVGAGSSQLIKAFSRVAGENYPAIVIQGQTLTATGVGGYRTVTSSN